MCAHATRVFAVWPLRSLSARSRSPLLRSPNQRRIWRQLVRVVIACLSISPVRRRGRGLRSVHGELRRAYRAFITCWQTETGLLLPTGMLPAPYGLAPPLLGCWIWLGSARGSFSASLARLNRCAWRQELGSATVRYWFLLTEPFCVTGGAPSLHVALLWAIGAGPSAVVAF